MKNKLIDLNNHLFMALEKLNDELSRKPKILDDIEDSKDHNFEENDLQDEMYPYEDREEWNTLKAAKEALKSISLN
jgi:hypothetical protein